MISSPAGAKKNEGWGPNDPSLATNNSQVDRSLALRHFSFAASTGEKVLSISPENVPSKSVSNPSTTSHFTPKLASRIGAITRSLACFVAMHKRFPS
jgi:hypothetical protein